MGYAKAVERVERATRALEDANIELEDSQKHLVKSTDEYYMLLITGASYSELVAGRAQRDAARRRRIAARESLSAAEVEEKASKEGLEGLEDRLKLQNLLIDQLTLLLRKQAELVADDAAKAARVPKAGKLDIPFELPELIMPEMYGADLDKEFEDLKERIRLKFAELWEGIVEDWEESGAGQALADMQQAWNDLLLQIEQDGPEIQAGIAAVVDPIRDWIREDLWNWVVLEWDKWVVWWEVEGPALAGLVDTTLKALDASLGTTEEKVSALSTAFLVLRLSFETFFSLLRMAGTIMLRVADWDWAGVVEAADTAMKEIATNLFDQRLGADQLSPFVGAIELAQQDFIDAGAMLGKAVQKGMSDKVASPATIITFERAGFGLGLRWTAAVEEGIESQVPTVGDVGAGLAASLGTGMETELAGVPGDRFMLPVVEKLTRSSQVWSDAGVVLGRALGAGTGKGVKEGAADLDTILTEIGTKVNTWIKSVGKKTAAPPLTETLSSMTTAAETHFDKVLPIYTQESIWLGITLPKAGKALKDSQVDDVWPEITDAVTSSFSRILPKYVQMVRWQGITIPIAGAVLQAAMELNWAAISLAVEAAWAAILLDLEEMEVWFITTLPDALVVLAEYFEEQMTLIYDYIYKTYEYWGGFVSSVEMFWKWLQDRTFVIDVEINVPPEGELGSPLKIHSAWIDFENYLKSTTFNARMDLLDVSGSGREAGTTHFYIESLTLEGVQDPRGLLRQLQEMV